MHIHRVECDALWDDPRLRGVDELVEVEERADLVLEVVEYGEAERDEQRGQERNGSSSRR